MPSVAGYTECLVKHSLHLFQRGEHFLCVSVHLHLRKHLAHLAVAIDYERGPLDSHELAPVQRLLLVNPVGFRDLVVGIAQQRKVERILRDKLLMRRRRIGADPDDFGPQRANFLDMIAEAARLGRAARRLAPSCPRVLAHRSCCRWWTPLYSSPSRSSCLGAGVEAPRLYLKSAADYGAKPPAAPRPPPLAWLGLGWTIVSRARSPPFFARFLDPQLTTWRGGSTLAAFH